MSIFGKKNSAQVGVCGTIAEVVWHDAEARVGDMPVHYLQGPKLWNRNYLTLGVT